MNFIYQFLDILVFFVVIITIFLNSLYSHLKYQLKDKTKKISKLNLLHTRFMLLHIRKCFKYLWIFWIVILIYLLFRFI